MDDFLFDEEVFILGQFGRSMATYLLDAALRSPVKPELVLHSQLLCRDLGWLPTVNPSGNPQAEGFRFVFQVNQCIE